MIPVGLIASALSIWQAQAMDTYTFKHVAASYVVARLKEAEGFIPAGLRVEADASTNRAVLVGPKDDVERLKIHFGLFDVRPMRVALEVEDTLPLLDFVYKNSSQVTNNNEWVLAEKQLGLEIKIRPRIRDDGHISLDIEHAYAGSSSRVVAGVRLNETLRIVSGRVDREGFRSPSPPPGTPDFVLKIRVASLIPGKSG